MSAGAFFAISACKSEGSPASDTSKSDPNAPVAQPSSTGAAALSPAAANLSAKCPAGRWSYDYADQALEVMMKNAADAKVLKEAGSFICTVSEGTDGTVACETQGQPVENVVEANQSGMKMIISVTIDGKASTRFRLLDSQNMKVASSDTRGLRIDTKVTLGGREIPFPTNELIGIFGKADSTLAYKCESGKLYLKPQVDGLETTWQELEPVR